MQIFIFSILKVICFIIYFDFDFIMYVRNHICLFDEKKNRPISTDHTSVLQTINGEDHPGF